MPTRRELLIGSVAGAAWAACGGNGSRPAPHDGACALTSADVEGPYYVPGAPRRSSLVGPGGAGALLALVGVVRDVRCAPIPGATLDLWQANQFGHYDRAGYGLRGQLVTDDAGRYALTTIMPGRYRSEGQVRPAHIHVKVSAPGYRVLTTQVYFRGDPYADADPHYRADRAVVVEDVAGRGKRAVFDFAIPAL